MIDPVIGGDQADGLSMHVTPLEPTFVTIDGHPRRFARVY
jgi:hypothetical protein